MLIKGVLLVEFVYELVVVIGLDVFDFIGVLVWVDDIIFVVIRFFGLLF